MIFNGNQLDQNNTYAVPGSRMDLLQRSNSGRVGSGRVQQSCALLHGADLAIQRKKGRVQNNVITPN
jgi:hypothetical protein